MNIINKFFKKFVNVLNNFTLISPQVALYFTYHDIICNFKYSTYSLWNKSTLKHQFSQQIYNKSYLYNFIFFRLADIDLIVSIVTNKEFSKRDLQSARIIKNTVNKAHKETNQILNLLSFILVFQKFKIFKISSFIKLFTNIKNLIHVIIFNIKWILLAAIISFIYFFFSLFYIQIDFMRQLAIWYLVMIAYYLLMSTFNSFLNKYKYGKFTTAIQRFWKRTGIIFWILEGVWLILFFYYFLNSSQEPLYMFDYASLNQEYLIPLKTSYKNLIFLSLAIYLSFILMLNLNYFVFSQSILLLMLISLIVFYTLYIETYQFVYVMNLFSEKLWIFDQEEQIWVLETEQSNLRTRLQYFILCLVAKYWHFIFIFVSWFFLLIKSLEINKINITLLSYNIQNLLILYVLNIMCLIQWVRVIFKKFLEITYYWFYIQYDEKFYVNFIAELWNMIFSYFSVNTIFVNLDKIIILSNHLYFSNELNLWKYI